MKQRLYFNHQKIEILKKHNIILIIRKEIVLVISAAAAIVTMFFVPPSFGYFSYLDIRVLVLLFCLMAVVAGFRQAGVFDYLTQVLAKRTKSVRGLIFMLTMLPFFASMLITNDVALLTFVPFAMMALSRAGQTKHLIFTVVLQTLGANLGSMLTPVGNPQNLFVFSYYQLSLGEFFRITVPIAALSFFLLTMLVLFIKEETISVDTSKKTKVGHQKLLFYGSLFFFCLLTVLRVFPYGLTFAVVSVSLILFDRGIFRRVDYGLLLTFVCFFVFVGNLGAMEPMRHFIENAMAGRELLMSILLSQVISNVPTAVLLAAFTENYKALLLGVNIGGLGTLVASLASLISYKIYCAAEQANPTKYLLVFTGLNVGILAVLYAVTVIFYQGGIPFGT